MGNKTICEAKLQEYIEYTTDMNGVERLKTTTELKMSCGMRLMWLEGSEIEIFRFCPNCGLRISVQVLKPKTITKTN